MEVTFGVDLQLIIQLVISVILPLLVGLVTKWSTSPATKAILLALLSVITSGLNELLTAIVTGQTFDFGIWLVAAIGTFAIAVATHFGLWKPTEVTAVVQSVGSDDKRTTSYRTS